MERIKPLSLIQYEVKEWTLANFGKQPPANPILGMIEECGELAHAHLKQIQGIRKSDYLADKKDAVGDIVIYLLNLYNAKGCNISLVEEDYTVRNPNVSSYEYLCRASLNIAKLARFVNVNNRLPVSSELTKNILSALRSYSLIEGFDLIQTVNEVWSVVSKRNWKKYPVNGIDE